MYALALMGEKRMEEPAGAALLEEAIALAPRANHPVYLAWALGVLANLLLRRRAVGEARSLLQEFLARGSARFGVFEAIVIYHSARAAVMAGDLDGAEAGFAAAENAARRTASPIGLSYAIFGKGSLAFARGNLAEARRCYDEALAMDTLVDPGVVSQDQYVLVKVCLAQGDVEAARGYAAAMEIAAERTASTGQREPAYIAFAHVASGLLAIADGRDGDAEPLFLAAIGTLTAIPIVDGVADVVDGLATCAGMRGDEARATRLTHLARGLRDGSRPVESVVDAVS
jgi:tetratricopeptide (TPR) repeat protein